jgi:5-methylcytosine-specific restriction endonuclease McrA
MPERTPSARQRQAVARRARRLCEYCRSPDRYAPDPFSIDHVQPQARGGSHRISNLAYACAGCNGRKHTAIEARDPATGEIVPLYHPRRDRWSDHFAWSEDSAEILGHTAVGRATIARLELNRPHLTNLRRLLHAIGVHPPPEIEPSGQG